MRTSRYNRRKKIVNFFPRNTLEDLATATGKARVYLLERQELVAIVMENFDILFDNISSEMEQYVKDAKL